MDIRPVKIEWWGTDVVICLERGANDLHMVWLMPLPPCKLVTGLVTFSTRIVI